MLLTGVMQILKKERKNSKKYSNESPFVVYLFFLLWLLCCFQSVFLLGWLAVYCLFLLKYFSIFPSIYLSNLSFPIEIPHVDRQVAPYPFLRRSWRSVVWGGRDFYLFMIYSFIYLFIYNYLFSFYGMS